MTQNDPEQRKGPGVLGHRSVAPNTMISALFSVVQRCSAYSVACRSPAAPEVAPRLPELRAPGLADQPRHADANELQGDSIAVPLPGSDPHLRPATPPP